VTFEQDFTAFKKHFFASKTLWASAILPVVVALVPGVAPFVAANPELAATVVAGLMAGLRVVTSKKLSLPSKSK
jgi:uncharacterized membrane-anchored protein YitT (DUF2179 family)